MLPPVLLKWEIENYIREGIAHMKTLNYDRAELKALKHNFFMAKALYETIKDQAEEIQKKILAENEFYDAMEVDKRILEPFATFKMNDNDFQKFLDLCYEEYKKAGIEDKRGKEYCPEAEAHDLYLEAEKQLVLYGIELIPNGMREKETLKEAIKNVEYKEKVLDLILRLKC